MRAIAIKYYQELPGIEDKESQNLILIDKRTWRNLKLRRNRRGSIGKQLISSGKQSSDSNELTINHTFLLLSVKQLRLIGRRFFVVELKNESKFGLLSKQVYF